MGLGVATTATTSPSVPAQTAAATAADKKGVDHQAVR